MTMSGTGVVLCRLASIFYVVQALQYSGFVIQQLFHSPISGYGFVAAGVVAVVVPGLAAASVWYFAESISSFQGDNADTSLGDTANTHQLVVIGTFLVGIYTVLLGIESAARIEVVYWVQEASNSSSTSPDSAALIQNLPNRISYITQIVLGTLLIVGRNMILRIFHWTRYGGTSAS